MIGEVATLVLPLFSSADRKLSRI